MQKNMKNLYRYIGIGLIVSAIILLLEPLFFLMLLPESYYHLISSIPVWNYYEIAGLTFYIIGILLEIWILIISFILITQNVYSKQILYVTYGYVIYFLLGFLYYIPLLPNVYIIQMIIYLVGAIALYSFGIKKDNFLSRIIKGKIKT